MVAAPAFAIRKPAAAVFTLDDYVRGGTVSRGQAEALRVGVASRANILVAGGTSTVPGAWCSGLLRRTSEMRIGNRQV